MRLSNSIKDRLSTLSSNNLKEVNLLPPQTLHHLHQLLATIINLPTLEPATTILDLEEWEDLAAWEAWAVWEEWEEWEVLEAEWEAWEECREWAEWVEWEEWILR